MSAKPRFKPRLGWTIGTPGCTTVTTRRHSVDLHRVRMTDARDLTAEQVVENALQLFEDCNGVFHSQLCAMSESMAKAAGLKTSKKNGKVKVRRVRA